MKLKNVNIFFLMFVVGSTFLGGLFQKSYAEENGLEVKKKAEEITMDSQKRDDRYGYFPSDTTNQKRDLIKVIGGRAQKLGVKTVAVGLDPNFIQGHFSPWLRGPDRMVSGGEILIMDFHYDNLGRSRSFKSNF